MRGHIASRILKLEAAREAYNGRFILWSDSDDSGAVPERVELCGLSHEECLDLLEDNAEERRQ